MIGYLYFKLLIYYILFIFLVNLYFWLLILCFNFIVNSNGFIYFVVQL